MASIELDYFRNLLSAMKLGPDAVISLIKTDGTLLMKQGGQKGPTSDLLKSAIFTRMLETKSGSFVETSSIDGVERHYNFDRLGDLPLVLSVNLSTRELFAEWRSKAAVTAVALVGICGLLIVVTAFLTRELGRRTVAEHKLVVANAELFSLSMTDALTGLGNRRFFDDALARETGRAARHGGTVSLILLDVDHFKTFNDRYGHPKGDLVLRDVASVLARSARRPADGAFRIGGEEFAVILPDTSSLAALAVAKRIQTEIGSLQQLHEGSPVGLLTLSLGIAESCAEPSSITARADAALYKAKALGRNVALIDRPLSVAA